MKNTSYCQIQLNKGQATLISSHHLGFLSQWRWYALRVSDTGIFYAVRNARKGSTIYMHRLILGLEVGDARLADHRNGDTLDNRDGNLRIATAAQNCRNCRISKLNPSGFKGVTWDAYHHRWQAQITVDYRNIFLGRFATPEEAHAAYAMAANKYHGEFARVQ